MAKNYEVCNKEVTTSCGVVIAKSTYPINLLFKLAGDLLLSAKKLSKKPLLKNKNASTVSAIDFSVVTTSATGSLRSVRDFELKYDKLYLTERPYTPEKLKDLVNLTVKCKQKGFPNNKLNVLYESLLHGKEQATLDYLKLIHRLKKDLKEIFLNKLHEFKIIPWRERDNGFQEYTTPFLDFVEIYEFVTAEIEAVETIK